MSTSKVDPLAGYRSSLPIPDLAYSGTILYDAKDPDSKFVPIKPLRPPGAPNMLLILLDDAGFGSSSAFGGPCNTPTADEEVNLDMREIWPYGCGNSGVAFSCRVKPLRGSALCINRKVGIIGFTPISKEGKL